MKWTPLRFKWLMRFYPPLFGAGVKIKSISPDWKHINVMMKLTWYNKNIVGTQFGGSLYSMTDPFLMLMLMNILGKKYIVWDKDASIDFIKPGRTAVNVDFIITDEIINEIKKNTETGDKYLPKFELDVKDVEGKIIAKVHKTLYIRQKPV